MILTLIWSLFSYVYMIYSCQFTITVLVPDSRLHLLVGAIGNIRLLIKNPNKGNLVQIDSFLRVQMKGKKNFTIPSKV